MPAVRRPHAALAALLLVGAVGLSGCDVGSPDDQPSDRSSAAPTTPSATPLSAFDTTGLTVPRADFCEQVAPVDAQRALGGEVARSTSYGNGERAPLSRGVRDISHEFGCTWTATDDTRARAWVFTPPVTRARARRLAAAAAGGSCTPVAGAPSFGTPGAAVRCRDGARVRVVFSGLFGDAWLSCELDVARGAAGGGLADRTGQWCVTVAQAASATS